LPGLSKAPDQLFQGGVFVNAGEGVQVALGRLAGNLGQARQIGDAAPAIRGPSGRSGPERGARFESGRQGGLLQAPARLHDVRPEVLEQNGVRPEVTPHPSAWTIERSVPRKALRQNRKASP